MNPKHELELKEKNINKLLFEKGMVRDEHYIGHPWSLVKLVLLGQWAYVYTVILKNWKGGIRYVDLLAGSGTTKIKETDDVVKGSPFAVKEFAFKPFNDYVLVERNEERYNALLHNSKLIGEISKPLRGDCNRFVKDIFSNPLYHNLVFIDMEGFDVTWDSMFHIIKSKSDIVINFPTSSFERTKALANQQCLDKFYGNHLWFDKASNREEFLKLYMNRLTHAFIELRNKTPYVEAIRVGNNIYFYDMILLCKAGDYTDVWGNYMKSRWSGENPEHMKTLIDHLNKRSTRLDDF